MPEKLKRKISRLPKELKLLLEILKTDTKQNPLPNVNLDSEIDWNEFLALSKHHRIYPIIYSKLKKTGSESIPKSVIDSLHKSYLKNTFRMLDLSGEMENICRLFYDHNIRTLLLKGPVLAEALYGDLSLRTSSDLDLLILITDLEKVDHLLKENGYEKNDYIETVLNDWKWRHHHVTYFHSEKNMKVEIHWRLNPGPSKEPGFDDLWKRRQKSTLTRFPIFLLGNEDLFLFLITHGARHGWSRLRWLLDINQLSKQPLDWHKLISLLKEYHYLHIAGQTLLLASELLNSLLIQPFEPLLYKNRSLNLARDTLFYLEEKINLHTEPIPSHVAKFHQKYLFSIMSFQQKGLYIMSLLFPYPIDTKTFPLPEPLHFMYFPLRPVLCLWRKTRGTLLLKVSLK
ncbi:nucleotidyltransferase family protein [Bacillus salipaludis]|uniref:nucleotidyltransferase domain-containing protein n=1 Tax=Bacillus salipaludis TaxID=2547811 RepID=UPI003D1D86BF